MIGDCLVKAGGHGNREELLDEKSMLEEEATGFVDGLKVQ